MERQIKDKEQELEAQASKHRDLTFEKERELNTKERELNSLRSDNIEIERATLKEREGYHQNVQKFENELRRLRSELDVLSKES